MRKSIYGFIFLLTFFTKLEAVIKLNQPILPNGIVFPSQFQPTNGTHVVYLADVNATMIRQLFSVDYLLGANSVTNLSAPLVMGGSVLSFLISSDGSRVVFRSDKDADNVNELYGVPITGGAITKLNSALVANGDVNAFDISRNSARVVYRADQDIDGAEELYSVPITGGAVTKLNNALAANRDVVAFNISSDSVRVVYRADQDTDQVFELYSAQIAANGSTKLNSPLVANGNVASFQISPDGTQVVYLADQDTDTVSELYSAQIAATGSTKLNSPLVANGDVSLPFQISADSSRVVYRADQDMDGVSELYSAQIAATGSTKLNSPLVANGNVASFQISSDSTRVVYLADQDTDGISELYSAQIAATGGTKLNSPLVVNGDVSDFQISPDSARVVYRADQDTDTVNELYSAQIAATGSTKLNNALVANGGILSGFQISSDSLQVVYQADQDANTVNELYRASLAGGSNSKISAPLVMNGDVFSFVIHPLGNVVTYIADQEVDETFELYAAPIIQPFITSPLMVSTTLGATNFTYTITADNGPITGYGASGLPIWATLTNNVITGVPNGLGTFPITLSVTNDVGFDTQVLNLTVNPSNVVIVTPSATGFNGDFNGDGVLDLVAQKKTTATLIAFITNGADTSKALALNKKDKVVGANIINTNNALIVQNKTTVGAVLVDGNFSVISNLTLGSVASAKTKVVAAGDINGDGVADIITQQGKTIGALLSPSYATTTLVNTKKTTPKVVGVLPRIGASSNAVSSLVLAQGKKLFFYDIPTNAPFVPGEANEPQAGPIFDKKYKVVGAVAGTNLSTAKLIITKGKKVGIINYGANSLGVPIFETTKKLGKIVAPQ